MGNSQSIEGSDTRSVRSFKRSHFHSSSRSRDDFKDIGLGSTTSSVEPQSDPNFTWIGQRTYNIAQNRFYALPNDLEEVDRLHQQHYLVRSAFGTNYEIQVEGVFEPGARILDIGCGSATWLFEMATEYPAMECHGVDISPIFPSEIKPPNTFFQLANVLEGLPFPENWFSFVQQRLFMPALRTNEWLPVLTDIFRVIKPGGFIQLLEADPIIHKLPLEKQGFWLKWLDYRKSQHEDHSMARRLGKVLKKAGFESIERRYVSLPIGWSGPIGSLARDVFTGYLLGFMPRSAHGMGLTNAEYERLTRLFFDDCAESMAYMNLHVLTAQKVDKSLVQDKKDSF